MKRTPVNTSRKESENPDRCVRSYLLLPQMPVVIVTDAVVVVVVPFLLLFCYVPQKYNSCI
jgi:hypothetical protein